MLRKQETSLNFSYMYVFKIALILFTTSSLFFNELQKALLDQWTQFLITDSLIPANQISTDDFAGALANQTNLAIKGIIGIKAMSQIAQLVGNPAQSANYSVRFWFIRSKHHFDISAKLITAVHCYSVCHCMADFLCIIFGEAPYPIRKCGMNIYMFTSRVMTYFLQYGNSSRYYRWHTFRNWRLLTLGRQSWGLSYNLLADKLLKLDLFPASVYQMRQFEPRFLTTLANLSSRDRMV